MIIEAVKFIEQYVDQVHEKMTFTETSMILRSLNYMLELEPEKIFKYIKAQVPNLYTAHNLEIFQMVDILVDVAIVNEENEQISIGVSEILDTFSKHLAFLFNYSY